MSRLELRGFSGKFLSYIIQSITSQLANQRCGPELCAIIMQIRGTRWDFKGELFSSVNLFAVAIQLNQLSDPHSIVAAKRRNDTCAHA